MEKINTEKLSKNGNSPASVEEEATNSPTQEDANKKRKRGERKARKLLLKCNLKTIPDVGCVTIRKSDGILFVINNPDVYKHPQTGQLVVFGEAKVEFKSQKDKTEVEAEAAKKFMFTETSKTAGCDGKVDVATPIAEKDEEELDEAGIDDKFIELVMGQTNATRAQAIEALKNNNNDLIDAIMHLTTS